MLEDNGRVVETYASCEAFLDCFHSDKFACLLIDAYLPGMSGLELLENFHHDGHSLPAIMITGQRRRGCGGQGHEGVSARFR